MKLDQTMRSIQTNNNSLENNFVVTQKFAKKILHDIRSPMTALNYIAANNKQIPEAYRQLLTSAVDRINIIANNLQFSYEGFRIATHDGATLELDKNKEIVIVDDDKAVHELWRARLGELAMTENILATHMMTFNDFQEWFLSCKKPESCIYFIDYEFENSSTNGIQIIRNLYLQNRATLVTSHYSDENIIRLAQECGIVLFPKPALGTANFIIK